MSVPQEDVDEQSWPFATRLRPATLFTFLPTAPPAPPPPFSPDEDGRTLQEKKRGILAQLGRNTNRFHFLTRRVLIQGRTRAHTAHSLGECVKQPFGAV